jgi:hypothetical protein
VFVQHSRAQPRVLGALATVSKISFDDKRKARRCVTQFTPH